MQLPQKEKTFSELFTNFFKCALDFKHFQKKDESHRSCISEITDSEKRG